MTGVGKYAAMTVNERLFEAGLLSTFDAAVSDRDESKIRKLLKEVDVDELSISSIISRVLD